MRRVAFPLVLALVAAGWVGVSAASEVPDLCPPGDSELADGGPYCTQLCPDGRLIVTREYFTDGTYADTGETCETVSTTVPESVAPTTVPVPSPVRGPVSGLPTSTG